VEPTIRVWCDNWAYLQCGLFRTGNLWGHGGFSVASHPDMVTVAKALGNGYPIGAVLMREEVGKVMGFGACIRGENEPEPEFETDRRQERMGRRSEGRRWRARLGTTCLNG
jgi:hypothetical protein